ncbi:hypothetical protein TNCV_3417611 [Trichonephila clavipes]|nr:hypothetical protein TNCV_3417611 [Trichonephila clavipes]
MNVGHRQRNGTTLRLILMKNPACACNIMMVGFEFGDTVKNVKTGKGPSTVASLIKLVQQFEETGSLDDRIRSRRPNLRKTRSARIAAEMETLASASAVGTERAWEAGRRLGLPPSLIRLCMKRLLVQSY